MALRRAPPARCDRRSRRRSVERALAAGRSAVSSDAMPDPTDGALQDAVAESMTTATPTITTTGGVSDLMHADCRRRHRGRRRAGRRRDAAARRSRSRARRVAPRERLEDELSHPVVEHADSLHKIAAFYQLLHTAIASGSDREVVRTFAEALSVWDEIEVFAYRADLDGRYTLEVSLPGSDVTSGPREIDASAFPVGAGLSRLSAARSAGSRLRALRRDGDRSPGGRRRTLGDRDDRRARSDGSRALRALCRSARARRERGAWRRDRQADVGGHATVRRQPVAARRGVARVERSGGGVERSRRICGVRRPRAHPSWSSATA